MTSFSEKTENDLLTQIKGVKGVCKGQIFACMVFMLHSLYLNNFDKNSTRCVRVHVGVCHRVPWVGLY